jgi:hypothetical protein
MLMWSSNGCLIGLPIYLRLPPGNLKILFIWSIPNIYFDHQQNTMEQGLFEKPVRAFMDLLCFFSFLIYTQFVRLLGRGISSSQGRYLHTEYTHTNIHASSGIRAHDSSVLAGEDGSCVRRRRHCDRQDSWISWYFHETGRLITELTSSHSQWKNPSRYRLDRRLGGPQSRSGRSGE